MRVQDSSPNVECVMSIVGEKEWMRHTVDTEERDRLGAQ